VDELLLAKVAPVLPGPFIERGLKILRSLFILFFTVLVAPEEEDMKGTCDDPRRVCANEAIGT